MLVPLPEAYGALRAAAPPAAPACPASIPSAAAPRTTTGSLNSTAMRTAEPAAYAPSRSGEDAHTADGGTASIAMSAEWPSEPGEPGAGSVRLAALPAASVMLPPDRRAPEPA